MASKNAATDTTAPRPGTILVMMVGLFAFFGMVSRMGKVNEPGELLSTRSDNQERLSLQERQRRAIAVIGGERITQHRVEMDGDAREVEEAPSNRVDEPERPPAGPAPLERDRSYRVQRGDTLYSIARVVFGDGNRWREIVEANPGLTPTALRPGMRLRLPSTSPVVRRDRASGNDPL